MHVALVAKIRRLEHLPGIWAALKHFQWYKIKRSKLSEPSLEHLLVASSNFFRVEKSTSTAVGVRIQSQTPTMINFKQLLISTSVVHTPLKFKMKLKIKLESVKWVNIADFYNVISKTGISNSPLQISWITSNIICCLKLQQFPAFLETKSCLALKSREV